MRQGFTLVELAIVITIIGLLIGGVLKGQELLENSRMTATANNVKSFEAALTTFRDIYKSLPGDSANATNFIQGCTAANNCVVGNGNGMINGTTTEWYNGFGGAENFQAWKHMALAGLITGVDTTLVQPASFQAGRHEPPVPLGGMFYIKSFTSAGTSIDYSLQGIILLATTDATGGNTNPYTSYTSSTAMKMDMKMDDGIAATGDLHSVSLSWTSGCGTTANGANGYNPNAAGKVCDIGFKIAP